MTNKKFKFAAMSVALTACVAAQPLMANAVEPDAATEPAGSGETQPAESQKDEQQPTNPEPAKEETQEAFSGNSVGSFSAPEEPEAENEEEKQEEAKEEKEEPEQEQASEQEAMGGSDGGTENQGTESGSEGKEAEGEQESGHEQGTVGGSEGGSTEQPGAGTSGENTPSASTEGGTTPAGSGENTSGSETPANQPAAPEQSTLNGEGENETTPSAPNPEKPDEITTTEAGKTENTGEDGQQSTARSEGESEDGTTTTAPIQNDEGEKIGTITKTETPEKSESEVKPNPGADPIPDTTKPDKVEQNDDGSTTITTPTLTPGKETTTTTGSGSASASTKEEFPTKKEDINLNDELGDAKIDWNVEENTPVGDTGYKVDTVSNDGNKQTLTLKKETETTGTMTPDDIAKLVDAERTDNPDGTYTLSRTEKYTDEDGNEQTRTTYITVEGTGTVTIKTTTILTVTREKEEHKDNTVDVSNNFEYPEIKADNVVTDDDGNPISSEIVDGSLIEKILTGNYKQDDNTYYYKETDGDVTKEYFITKDGSKKEMTNAELAEKLKEQFGADHYKLGEDGEIYYIADGQNAKLEITQRDAYRELFSLKVEVKVTTKSDKTYTEGKQEAEDSATKKAIIDALTNALVEMGLTKDEAAAAVAAKADSIVLAGGTFTTDAIGPDGKVYTLTYTSNSVTPGTSSELPDEGGRTDVKDNIVNGSANVRKGQATWSTSEKYSELTENSYTDGICPDFDFTKAPDDAKNVRTKNGYVTYYELNGKIYEFTYDTNATIEGKTGTFTTVSWTVTTPAGTTTTPEEKDERPAESFEISKPWNMTGNDTDGYDFTYEGGSASGLHYQGKDADGNDLYEGTAADGTVTTITVKSTAVDEDLIEAKLKAQYGSTVELDRINKTFTYTEGNTSYKGSYSSVEQTIDVVKKAPYEVAGTGYSEKEAEDAILANIKKALASLGEDEELVYNGTYHITTDTEWEDIVEYVKTVVNYDALTKEDLSALLKQQKEAAAGKDYTGTTKGTWYVDSNGNKIDRNRVHYDPKTGGYYYNEGWGHWAKRVPVTKVTTEDDYIGHLDLATDSNLTLAEKNAEGKLTDDCVLINKKLEWNEDADNLLDGIGNTIVGLGDRITYDDENDKDPTTGHYEFARATWDNQYPGYGDRNAKDNNPDRSVFYKLTGTVAYGQVGETYTAEKVGNYWDGYYYDYASARSQAEAALKKYKEDYVKNGGNIEDLKNAQVVEICADQTPYGERSYKIYLYTSSLTAYGYLSDASNTCGNAHYNAQNKNSYVGGYDLTIGDLTQISKEEIVAQGKNVFNYSTTLTKISRIRSKANQTITATPGTKTTTVITPAEEKNGSYTSGTYTVSHDESKDFTESGSPAGISGTGDDHYKSFREWVYSFFSGKTEKEQCKDTGSFTYDYTTETPLQAEAKNTIVEKTAKVSYTYKTVETRDVLIPGEDVVHIDPEVPDGPETPSSDENTMDTPVLPTNPELPPVQDARPDAPVLPANPELPPVQDARMDAVSFSALPQTGVNWRTAIGLAFSGMALMAAGAFTTLTGKKEKH